MGRHAGSIAKIGSDLQISFADIPHDPFIEGSKLAAYGDALRRVVKGALSLNTDDNSIFSYSRKTCQVTVTVHYRQPNGAEKAALFGALIKGAKVTVIENVANEMPTKSVKVAKKRGRPAKKQVVAAIAKPVVPAVPKVDLEETFAKLRELMTPTVETIELA